MTSWQVIPGVVLAVSFVVIFVFVLPESATWDMLCYTVEFAGQSCDAQSDDRYGQLVAEIATLRLFTTTLIALTITTIAIVAFLNWFIENMPLIIAIKKAFWVFQFPQSVLTLMMLVFAVISLHFFLQLLDGAREDHIIPLFGAAITVFIAIAFTLVTMRFSAKHKQEIEAQLGKLDDIDNTLTKMNNTLKNTSSALEKNADMLEKINSALEKNASALEDINKKLDRLPNDP